MYWGRLVAGVVGGLGLIVGLAGCGVPAGGALGLTLGADGEPALVVQMCKGHIDGATVYISNDDPEKEQTLAKWQVDPALTGFSQFSIAKGGNGWRVDQPFTPLDKPATYTIYGWSDDNSWSAAHLDFSEADLSKLQPGQVLHSAGTDLLTTGSVDDFKSEVCKQNWG
jgi:hypothetical protein